MRMPNGNKQRRVLIRPGIQVFLQMELGFRVKIYNPLLVTLAEDNAFRPVDVLCCSAILDTYQSIFCHRLKQKSDQYPDEFS